MRSIASVFFVRQRLPRRLVFLGTLIGLVIAHAAPTAARPLLRQPLAATQQADQITAQAAADDAWDDRFGAPGITCCVGFDDTVAAAQARGNDVFVGGTFDEVANLDGTAGVARWDGRRWHGLGGGLAREKDRGDVRDLAVSGDNVYVVGNFDKAGTVAALNVARWNVTTGTWSALGTGTGPRDQFGGVVPLSAVAVVDGQVYVGGTFRSINGVTAAGVAVWNGTQWAALAGGVIDTKDDKADVRALLAVGNQVFVGGLFDQAVNPQGVADIAASNIAVWNRSTGRWAALGVGASAPVDALATDGSSLYVGGSFVRAGGGVVNAVARWNGTQWSALGSGVAGVVYGMTVAGGKLYVAGAFDAASGVANTDSLAVWNGAQWSSLRTDQLLNDPPEQFINAVAVADSGEVLAAGSFNDTAAPLFRSIAVWDGARWRGTGQGLTDGYVNPGDGYALAVTRDGQAFVGGEFSEIGGVPLRNLALWDGANWRDVGGGVDGDVSALVLRGDELYVGGKFNTVGNGVAALNVARWNLRTQTWSAVGNGLPNGYVNDLVFVGDVLYAGGGDFPTQTECCLWKWNGTAWAPFSQRYLTKYFNSGIGFGGETKVFALATDGARLFVGGRFIDIQQRADGAVTAANQIFVYDPATDQVSVFGDGTEANTGVAKANAPADVLALAVADGALYIGGIFENVQKVAAVNIARLGGGGWTALGTGVVGTDGAVRALAVDGAELYVGGSFEVAGTQAFNVARWNIVSRSWSALGCGITRWDDSLSVESVTGLAVQPRGLPNAGLYVTGGFLNAGCKPAEGFAIWRNFGVGQLTARNYLPQVQR